MTPSKDQFTGMLERAATVFFTWLLTYASTKGWITTSQVSEFLPVLIGLATVAIGYYVNRPQNLLQAVANIPEVKKVDMDRSTIGAKLANAVPSNKVNVQ